MRKTSLLSIFFVSCVAIAQTTLPPGSLPSGLKVGDVVKSVDPSYTLTVTEVGPRFSIDNSAKWGEPKLVNGKKDYTLVLRKCYDAASQEAANTNTQQTVYIPEGEYGVCLQDTDTNLWAPCLYLNSNVTIQGKGSTLSKVVFYSKGMTDPKTSWENTTNDYVKIKRGGVFRALATASSKVNITIRGLTIDGQAGYTGDFTVGGNRLTGNGWDMTHKGLAFDGSKEISGILIDDVVVCNFRGECIWSGGGCRSISIKNSKVWGTNASAVSCSAIFIMENSVIGGDTAEKQVYNGTENQAVFAYQSSVYRNVKVQPRVAPTKGGNAFVHIGCVGSTLLMDGCEATQASKGILFSNQAHDCLVKNSKFTNCNQAALTSSFQSVAEGSANRFQNITFDSCESTCLSLFTSQHSGPALMCNWGALAFKNCTVKTGTLLEGPFYGNFDSFTVENCTFAKNCKIHNNGMSANTAPLVTGSVYDPTSTFMFTCAPKVDIFNTTLTSYTLNLFGDRVCLNAVPNAMPVLFDVKTYNYPVGFTAELLVNSSKWVLKADSESNTFPADVTVPAGQKIKLRVNTEKKFEVVP